MRRAKAAWDRRPTAHCRSTGSFRIHLDLLESASCAEGAGEADSGPRSFHRQQARDWNGSRDHFPRSTARHRRDSRSVAGRVHGEVPCSFGCPLIDSRPSSSGRPNRHCSRCGDRTRAAAATRSRAFVSTREEGRIAPGSGLKSKTSRIPRTSIPSTLLPARVDEWSARSATLLERTLIVCRNAMCASRL